MVEVMDSLEADIYISEKLSDGTYGEERKMEYVEGFNTTKNANYKKRKPYYGKYNDKEKTISVEYSFNINKMAVDYYFWDTVSEDKEYKIRYVEYNPDTDVTLEKEYLGCKFEDWNRDLQITEFIMNDVSGYAKEENTI